MRTKGLFAVLLMVSLLPSAPPRADTKLRVVASILPVHSLVSAVTHGVVTPVMILPGNMSPHFHQLRPSQARALHQADVVFWVGPGMESFLTRSLEGLGPETRVVGLMESPGIRPLRNREHVDWLRHHFESSEEEGDHHPLGVDSHIWLSPDNARRLVHEIVRVLVEVDASNRALYTRNGEKTAARISKLAEILSTNLGPVREIPYIVFHDAYRYFEDYFELSALGAVTASPERAPSAKRVAALRDLITQNDIKCMFVAPQHSQSWVNALSDDHDVRVGVLDPLGAELEPGRHAYFTLMRANASALINCLSP